MGRQQTGSRPQPGRFRLPRWLAATAGVAGTLLGLATNLYSAEFRQALQTFGQHIDPTVVSVLVATVVASTTTVLIYGWLAAHKQRTHIVHGEIKIQSDVLKLGISQDDSVVGRSLHYLETRRGTDELVVFLHGLGLDASDFRPYMIESRLHCVALTQFGFNAEETTDEHYAPISLESHVHLLAYALDKIRRANPRKRLTLVGFSYGADMILLLVQLAAELFEALSIDQALLLDPNINRQSTTISSKIAVVDKDRPLDQLVEVLTSATDVGEFRYLCEYLYKITSKNFRQIQRHAQDVVKIWADEGYDTFLDYLGQLISATHGVHVVLSFSHENLFNAVATSAVSRGLDADNLECSRRDHFELIDPAFLKDRLEGLL